MEASTSTLSLKNPYRSRCISLPTRSDPTTLQVDGQLYRLKSSSSFGATLSNWASSSILCQKLRALKELYDSVEDLLQLPLTQQSLAHERAECLDETLDGTLRLLDICGITGDALFQLKECIQDLQSSIRRRAGRDFRSENEDPRYWVARKQVNEVICKCLRDLKRAENRGLAIPTLLEKNHKLVAVIGVLREVEAITLSIFESLLSFLNRLTSSTKPTGWSLVSKLMQKRCERMHSRQEAEVFEDIGLALSTLPNKSNKCIEFVNPQNVQKQLKIMELSILSLQDGLEPVFRSLIKTRVSLLNVLNH